MTKQGCDDEARMPRPGKLREPEKNFQSLRAPSGARFWALALNFHQAVGLGKIVFPLVRPLEKNRIFGAGGLPPMK